MRRQSKSLWQWLPLCLCALVVNSARAQINITNLPNTNNLPSTARFIVDVSGRTRSITASNLLNSLTNLPNWPISSGGGVTNNQFLPGSPVSTNYTGNAAGLTNLPFATNATTLWVDKNGSDATGRRGRFDLPFLTISNAIAQSQPGDTIRVGPGRYLEERVIPKNGQTIIGAGGSNTLVASTFTLGSIFQLTNNLTAGGLTIHATLTDGTYQFPIGGGSATATNVNLTDFNIIGNSDALYITDSGDGLYQINVWNSYWRSWADTCNLNQDFHVDEFEPPGPNVNSTNTFVNLNNCVLECVWANDTIIGGFARALSTRNSTIRMTGGRIIARNAPTSTAGAWLGQGNSGAGKIELSGVMIETASTNGIVSDVTNHISSGFIYVNGSLYDKVHGTNIVLKGAMWVTNSVISSGGIRPAYSNMVVGVGVNPTTGIGKIAFNPDGSAKFSDNAISITSGGIIRGADPNALSITPTGNITNALGTLVGDEFDNVALAGGNMTWTGLATGNGSAITGDDEAYGAGWDSDTTLPTKNALYDKIQTIGGGGGNAWLTNGNSGLPAGSFLGTLDNFDLILRSSNSTLADFSGYSNTITLGTFNNITGWQPHSTIAGGLGNLIHGATNSAFHYLLGYNFIGGGATNSINEGSGVLGRSFIGGGFYNSSVNSDASALVIVGGGNNTNEGSGAFIGGGYFNWIDALNTYSNGNFGVIAGGYTNLVSGDYGVVSGGFSNRAHASFATVPGGNQNLASGSNSIAMGFRARATHPGSVVISADVSATTGQNSPADNSFTVNASGGINLLGSSITGNGAGLTNIGGIKVYRALLTQSGTAAPTADVFENTIGAIVWARSSLGVYTATLSGAFPANKTFVSPRAAFATDATGITIVRTSANVITITAGDDDLLYPEQDITILVKP